jgi:hypothetical protein
MPVILKNAIRTAQKEKPKASPIDPVKHSKRALVRSLARQTKDDDETAYLIYDGQVKKISRKSKYFLDMLELEE